MRTASLWNKLHQVPQYQNIGKPNNLIVLGSNIAKESTQNIQNRIKYRNNETHIKTLMYIFFRFPSLLF